LLPKLLDDGNGGWKASLLLLELGSGGSFDLSELLDDGNGGWKASLLLELGSEGSFGGVGSSLPEQEKVNTIASTRLAVSEMILSLFMGSLPLLNFSPRHASPFLRSALPKGSISLCLYSAF